MTCPTLGPGLLVALNGVNAQSWLANLNVLNGLNAASGYGIFNPATKPFERFARVRLNGFSSRQRIESTRKFIQATKLRDYSSFNCIYSCCFSYQPIASLNFQYNATATVYRYRQFCQCASYAAGSQPFIHARHIKCGKFHVIQQVK